MALEREKTNVAIGNMPYVRPSNVLGSLAKEVQQEAIKRQKEIDTENENIEIAEKTALFFNSSADIAANQERPDAEAFGLELKKTFQRITSEKTTPNRRVRNKLRASFQGIMSAQINGILKEQTKLETKENVERVENNMNLAIDMANIERETGVENIGVHRARLEELGKELVAQSRGTISPSQANAIVRSKIFEMEVTGIATRYSDMMADGNAIGAEKYLNNAIDAYGKSLKEERGFRKIFAEELKINGFESKIQRAQILEFARFGGMTLDQQEKYLAENSDKMEPSIFETYNDLVISRRLDITGIDLDASLANMLKLQTPKNVEILGRKLIDQYPRQAAKIRSAVLSNKKRIIREAAEDSANAAKLQQKTEDAIDYKKSTEVQKKWQLLPEKALTHSSSNRLYNSSQAASLSHRNDEIKRVHKLVQDRGNGKTVTPLDVKSEQAQFIDAQFERIVGKKLNEYLNNEEMPQDSDLALSIGESINQYNYIPKQIRELFTSDVLQMPSSQIKKVSEIYNSIVEGHGRHLDEDVTNVLQNVPINFREFMRFARTGSIQQIDAFKEDARATEGKLVAGNIEAKTTATLENTEAIPNALIKGNVESSYMGRAWDKAWNQVGGDALSVSPWWSAYLTVTRPSALSSAFQSWRIGGFSGVLTGFEAEDFTSTMDQQTKGLYTNALRQVYAENPNISQEQAASYAIDKIADVTTPSIFMAADPERADDDRSNLYQLHAYSPEAMLMNEKLSPEVRMSHDEVSIAMIETARLALGLNMIESGKGEKYLEDMFNLRPDGPDRVLFSPEAKTGKLKVDLGLLMLSGRLAFKNGRKDAKTGQMSYEIHIATQGLERNDKFVWKKIRVPGKSASTAYHFPIGKNIPALKNRSFHSDLARLVTFAKDPSSLGEAAFYKAKSSLGKMVDSVGEYFDR